MSSHPDVKRDGNQPTNVISLDVHRAKLEFLSRFRIAILNESPAALPLRAKAVGWALSMRASVNEQGEHTCWPSHEMIALDAGCTERTVRRALRELERHGYVIIEHRSTLYGRTSNAYKLEIPLHAWCALSWDDDDPNGHIVR